MTGNLPGAFVVSLDFELHWGMRDAKRPGGALTENLVRSRAVVRDLAKVFSERGIHATWATVGMLFASSRSELETYLPEIRPEYSRPGLDPYVESIGSDEEEDPIHLAGSLVDMLERSPFQEVGSHTFSHYYGLEPGQNEETLRADLASATAIARSHEVDLRSLVWPRNQWNPAYDRVLKDSGFVCYRGPQPSWSHQPRDDGSSSYAKRAVRLSESYFGASPPPTCEWHHVRSEDGLCNVPASAFLRPYNPRTARLVPLQLSRLQSGMRTAARRKRIFHLWWHPHNFSDHRTESFGMLERILDEFDRLARTDGFVSMSMGDVATACGATS
jgi:hypothetical protein